MTRKVFEELDVRILRAVALDPDLSQRALAKRFGVSPPTIAKVVARHREKQKALRLAKIKQVAAERAEVIPC